MIFHDLFRNEQPETGTALGLLGREIGIENLRYLFGADPRPGVGDTHVDIKLFQDAAHFDRAFAVGRRLNGIDHYVLNGTGDLDGITHDRAGIIRHIALQFDAVFFRHRADAVHDFADNFRNRNVLVGSGLHAAVVLPHPEEIAAEPDILLDNFEFLVRAATRAGAVRLFGRGGG